MTTPHAPIDPSSAPRGITTRRLAIELTRLIFDQGETPHVRCTMIQFLSGVPGFEDRGPTITQQAFTDFMEGVLKKWAVRIVEMREQNSERTDQGTNHAQPT